MSRKRILKHIKHSSKSGQHKPNVVRCNVDKKGVREEKREENSRVKTQYTVQNKNSFWGCIFFYLNYI